MRLLFTLLFLLLSTNAYAVDYTADANCVSAWLFDTADSPTLDACGSNTGTITGATYTTSGNPGAFSTGYYDYDGANDRINYGDIPTADDATDLSVVAWVYQDNSTQDHWIFGQSDSTLGSRGVFFQFDDVSSSSSRTNVYRIFILENGGGSTSANLETPSNGASSGVWEHVAFTFDATSSTGLRLYVDCVEVADSPVSVASVANAGQTNSDFCSGERCSSGIHDRDGRIDEIGVFDRILSSTEICDIMNNGLEGSAAVADTTGGNFHGNIKFYGDVKVR